MNFGASFTGVTFNVPPIIAVQGADNGLSLSGTNAQLGQDPGAPGNPAALLNDREFIMNGWRMTFLDSTVNSIFQLGLQSFDLASPNPGINVNSTLTTQVAGLLSNGTNLNALLTFGVSAVQQWISGPGVEAGLAIHPNTVMAAPGAGNVFIDFPRVGVGIIPTARLHIRAGTAGASGAPFKYTSGVANQTALENGAKNFNGTNEFLTAGGVNYTMAKTLTATAVLDFPSTAAQTSSDLTIAVTGAADGDVVNVGVPIAALAANGCFTAFVSAANTVTVRFNNYSAGPIDPGSGTFRVSIVKY